MKQIGDCPICGRCGYGALGIWRCADGASLVVMCDECYSVWRSPKKLSESDALFCADRSDALLATGVRVFEGQSGWAKRDEIERIGWARFIKN